MVRKINLGLHGIQKKKKKAMRLKTFVGDEKMIIIYKTKIIFISRKEINYTVEWLTVTN